MSKTIVLTGGGSGGHVVPNLALIPKLQERGYEVHYIGTEDGIERELVSGIPYHSIRAGKLRRYASSKNVSDVFKTFRGISDAKKILKELKPCAVFCKGGFVSVPVAFAAHSLKIPVVLHESDYTPGLANKMCAPKCNKICLSFDVDKERYGDKAVVTGSPIRDELMQGSREKGLEFLGFDGKKPVLMVMGGSLGAGALNDAVDSAIDELTKRFDIVHLRGKGHLSSELDSKAGYRQFEYLSAEIPDLFAASDLIFSRAGANAVFEFLALKKPALLVPLPLSQSRGDQILNAKYFKKNGYSEVLNEEDMTDETLLASLDSLWAEKDRYIEAMSNAPAAAGTQNVLNVILSMAE